MSGSEDASIEATTGFCPNYEGSFSELEVVATCYRTAFVGDSKYFAFLVINRVSGAFGSSINCSNGLSAHQFGNTTTFSDGVTAHQFGNTTTFSNGRNCHQFGNLFSCN